MSDQKTVTAEELNKSFDDVFATAMRVKAERDALLTACQRAYSELDERYEVERDSEGGHKEYPFSGAGEVLRYLKAAIDKAVA